MAATSHTLKDYQVKTLDALAGFFDAARGATTLTQIEQAYATARADALGESAPPLPYRPGPQHDFLLPQVCLRIPTGGGKTLLAAHAIELAARRYVGTPAPLVLWLVPSNTIRSQTLDALRAPGHPYREALLTHYPADRLTVIDIAECEQLRPQDFGGRTIVAVGTIQTLRVGNTASRDVYAYKEAFEPHFASTGDAPWLERIEQADLDAQPYLKPADIGKVKRSFANLLAMHRPIVMVDEAHNATTDLSLEVFRRIRPACLIEWTATPAPSQNVLYHVSAQELKSEQMVKLPIVLSPHPNWQEAVRDAVLARERLAEAATGEPDYVRPIVLFQADAKGGDAPVEVLKAYLVDTLKIADKRIAVATGDQRGLDNVDLFDRACPVEFVITVEALKEGWDCSFAYVFCTVQNVRSARDMEQLLGRVLRMPYARRRQAETLNRAYAHVCSPDTATVASQLADRLVSMGFEEMEAAQAIQMRLGEDLFAPRPPVPPAAESLVTLPEAAVKALVSAGAGQAADTSTGPGVALRGILAQAAIDAAVAAVPKRQQPEVRHQIERHQARALAAAAPAQRGEAFGRIGRLGVMHQGELVLLDADLLGELAPFTLTGADAALPAFVAAPGERPYLVDVERGKVRIQQDETSYGLDLDAAHEGVRREDVIRALDARVRRGDVLQPDMIAWLGRLIDGLLARDITLTHMARHLNSLADTVAGRLKELAQARRDKAFQAVLFGDAAKPTLADGHDFTYDPNRYPARWLFDGRWTFRKHWYPLPGELDPDIATEETACAIELDGMAEVKSWVRNLERQPEASFFLPTSTDRFYPDFVAELNDGRMLVVEYKGAHLVSNDDSKEKRDIGRVWAAASKGRCLFVMVTSPAQAGKPLGAQLREALG